MYISKKTKISPITCLSCLCLLSFMPIDDSKSTSPLPSPRRLIRSPHGPHRHPT